MIFWGCILIITPFWCNSGVTSVLPGLSVSRTEKYPTSLRDFLLEREIESPHNCCDHTSRVTFGVPSKTCPPGQSCCLHKSFLSMETEYSSLGNCPIYFVRCLLLILSHIFFHVWNEKYKALFLLLFPTFFSSWCSLSFLKSI